MASFTIRALVAAPIETVFEVFTDHRGYPAFTPLRSVALEREGTPAPDGVGAIRRLTAVGPPIREEVTEYVAPTRFVYRMLSGMPTRDHVGVVDLTQEPGGTRVVYRVDTFPTLPGPLALVVVGVLRLAIHQLFGGIKKTAERRAAGGA